MTLSGKMAASIRAELRFRGGSTEQQCVPVDNNLASLRGGIRELHANVTRLLTELVEREKVRGASAQAEEEEEDKEGEEEDSDEADGEPHPPAKRHRK